MMVRLRGPGSNMTLPARRGQGRQRLERLGAKFPMQGALILLSASAPIDAQTVPGVIETGSFRFSYDERGISGLAHARDPYGTVVVMAPSSFPSLGGLVIPTPADRAELVRADPS